VGQTLPQVPQLLLLDMVLTQAPLHAVRLPEQAQAPLTQDWPVVQAVPQWPQLLESVRVLTQTLPQLTCAPAHEPVEPPCPPFCTGLSVDPAEQLAPKTKTPSTPSQAPKLRMGDTLLVKKRGATRIVVRSW